MWYFTYDHRSNWRELLSSYRNVLPRVPLPSSRGPAVLANHRICFPVFSERWGGGVAGVAPAAGKSVGGALYEVPAKAIERLEDASDHTGRSTLTKISVVPYGSTRPVTAMAHLLDSAGGDHVPPSQHYLALLLRAASSLGHSTVWIDHLLSFMPGDSIPRERADQSSSVTRLARSERSLLASVM